MPDYELKEILITSLSKLRFWKMKRTEAFLVQASQMGCDSYIAKTTKV